MDFHKKLLGMLLTLAQTSMPIFSKIQEKLLFLSKFKIIFFRVLDFLLSHTHL